MSNSVVLQINNNKVTKKQVKKVVLCCDEAEAAVLACALRDDKALIEILEKLSEDDFYILEHKKIFNAIAKLSENNKAVDLVTIKEYAQDVSAEYIVQIYDSYVSSLMLNNNIKILKNYSLKRKLLEIAISLQEEVTSPYSDKEAATICKHYIELLYKTLSDFEIFEEDSSIKSLIVKVLEDELQEEEKIRTGFYDLDKYVNITAGTLTILAGRPGMGKTTFAVNLLLKLAQQDIAAVLFTLEMSKLALTQKILSILAGVDYSLLVRNKHKQDTALLSKLYQAAEEIVYKPAWIEECCSSLSELNSKLYKYKKRYNIKVAIVDYLQLIKADNHYKNRQEEVEEIVQRLKTYAIKYNIAILLLAQLNRKVEERKDKRPVLADLRDSGAIEQVADVVLLLYNQHYYEKRQENEIVELIIAKNRTGPSRTIKLLFRPRMQTFENLVEY